MTQLSLKDSKVADVISRVLNGSPLREAVKQAGLTPDAFHYRLSSDRTAALAYARAVEIKADLLADEVVHLADGDGDPAKVRNQMTARQWLASKLHAKRYGDRVDLNVTQTIDIGSTLAEARARLLPARYLDNPTDVQTIDSARVIDIRPSDYQSVNNAEPDIFS